MIIEMKAIPTTYAGTRFRSRLEARWAAFFDLAKLAWEYEPIDFDGWAPDFLIRTPAAPVYVEVKPVPLKLFDGRWWILQGDERFAKACAHWRHVQVMNLGTAPNDDADYFGLGSLMDPPPSADWGWWEVSRAFQIERATELWREAGNRVQWRAS